MAAGLALHYLSHNEVIADEDTLKKVDAALKYAESVGTRRYGVSFEFTSRNVRVEVPTRFRRDSDGVYRPVDLHAMNYPILKDYETTVLPRRRLEDGSYVVEMDAVSMKLAIVRETPLVVCPPTPKRGRPKRSARNRSKGGQAACSHQGQKPPE